MASFSFKPLVARLSPVRRFTVRTWRKYRALALWLQIVIGVLVVIALFALLIGIGKLGAPKATGDTLATVTLAPIAEISGGTSGVGVVGNVRSVTEASILAESGGVVRSVSTSVRRRAFWPSPVA